jgi:hypothetical protein
MLTTSGMVRLRSPADAVHIADVGPVRDSKRWRLAYHSAHPFPSPDQFNIYSDTPLGRPQ